MLPPLFFILSAWGMLFFAFSGIGLLLRRAFGLKSFSGTEEILDGFWLGLAFAIFFLQAWHLFFPVNLHAFIIVFATGMAGWLINRQALRAALIQKGALGGLEKIILLVFAGLVFLTAIQASRPPATYDSGLYYIQTVKWNLTYPIVPGLGNLHARFAINHSYFLYVSLIEAWSGQSLHLANGLLFLALLAKIFISLRNLLDRRHQLRMHEIFDILFFPAVLVQIFLIFFQSSAPDQVIFLLCVLITSRFLCFLEDAAVDAGQRDFLVFSLAALVFLGVTIKITFLIFGGTNLVIIAGSLLRASKNKSEVNLSKIFLWSSVTAVYAIGLWLVRSVILSGYPAYPAPLGAFPVDWRIPVASVKHILRSTTSYAHAVTNELGKDFTKFFLLIPPFLAAFGILATLFRKGWNKKNAGLNRKIWPFLVPTAVATLYWYISAPNLRFGMAYFWILAVGVLLQWINGLKNPRFLLVTYMIISGVLVLFQHKPLLMPSIPFIQNENMQERLDGLTQNQYKTLWGLNIYVPANGNQCWNADIPCTPYPHPGLRLRNPDNMKDGFRIEPLDDSDAFVGFYSVDAPEEWWL